MGGFDSRHSFNKQIKTMTTYQLIIPTFGAMIFVFMYKRTNCNVNLRGIIAFLVFTMVWPLIIIAAVMIYFYSITFEDINKD